MDAATRLPYYILEVYNQIKLISKLGIIY